MSDLASWFGDTVAHAGRAAQDAVWAAFCFAVACERAPRCRDREAAWSAVENTLTDAFARFGIPAPLEQFRWEL